jgi:glutathione S-transferase
MSTADLKPLTIHGHWGGPNPWKVRTILDELSLPYEWKVIEFADVKNEEYTKINPNGRLPTLEDPNTGITLWEVGQDYYVS